MKKLLLFSLVILIVTACQSNSNHKIERKDEPDIITVEGDDIEMNRAIRIARETLSRFDSALLSGNIAYNGFSLKRKFDTEKGGEHIWIADIVIKNGKYFGVVGNEPAATTEVKMGDTFEVDKERISDWMFFDNDTLRGGYTILVLRKRMTGEERKAFDAENGIIIKE